MTSMRRISVIVCVGLVCACTPEDSREPATDPTGGSGGPTDVSEADPGATGDTTGATPDVESDLDSAADTSGAGDATDDSGTDPVDDAGTDGTPPSGALQLAVDGAPVSSGASVPLPPLTPTPGVEARLLVSLKASADGPIAVAAVELAATNADGTPKNVWVALDFGVFDPESGFPHPLDESALAFEVVYSPQSFDTNSATLTVETDDPDQPEYTVVFLAPPVEADIRVEPPSAVFDEATLNQSEDVAFEIHNDGIAPLVVESVALSEPSGLFEVIDAPPAGAQIKPAGAIGAKPLAFTVRYKPVFGSDKDAATLEVVSDDPDEGTLSVPLSATFETVDETSPCVLSWPAQDAGVLDFSGAKTDPETIAVTMTNAGAGSDTCTLDGVGVPEDISQSFYSVKVSVLHPDGLAQELEQPLPIGVGPGFGFLFQVTYTPGASGLDGTFTVNYQDPLPKTAAIPTLGGGPEPCFDYAPGTAGSPIVLQLAGPAGASVAREATVYNCGSAPLVISKIAIDDPAMFALVGAGSGPHTVAPNGIARFTVGAVIDADPPTLKGEMTFHYKLASGSTTTTVPLERRAADEIVLPKADPGDSNDYAGVEALTEFELDGGGSIPGSEFLSSVGYIWYVVDKPGKSQLILNGPPGKPTRKVTVDVGGDYTFALVVKTLGGQPFYSEETTVVVSAEDP